MILADLEKNMKILAKCPACGRVLELELEDADKRKRCVMCRRMFKVPRQDQLEKALKIIETASGAVFVDESGRVFA